MAKRSRKSPAKKRVKTVEYACAGFVGAPDADEQDDILRWMRLATAITAHDLGRSDAVTHLETPVLNVGDCACPTDELLARNRRENFSRRVI